jgi:hypothetical protein
MDDNNGVQNYSYPEIRVNEHNQNLLEAADTRQ